jgi:glycerol kinase
MTRKYILALDLGTTGNRAIVFDHGQRIVARAYEEFRQYYPKPGWVEHDALEIWKSTLSVLSKVFKKISPSEIAAIGVTNQRETVVVWDKKTGRPIHRAIVWQDRRTASHCESLKQKGFEKKIHQKTGLVLDPYFSATKIAWILRNVPGAAKRAAGGQLLAGTVDSWVIWNLTQGKAHVTDASNASRTMLFNIHARRWDEELCRIFKIPTAILPKIAASSAVVGMLDKSIRDEEIPIAGIAGDQQAAAFAQGCFAAGTIKNTYGTGLFLVENTGSRPIFSKNLLTTVAWSLGNLKNTEYAIEGSVFIAGAAIQWLRDGLQILKHSRDCQTLAKTLSTNDDVYFVPALSGLGAPYWDPRARGTIVGLTRGTTRAHIARAALESIAYQTRDVLEVMRHDAKKKLKVLRVDGGAGANDWLLQFQADILGTKVERPKILETTALGAAGLAGLAVGFWKNKEEFARLRRVDKIFNPQMKRSRADALYARWKDAVRRSRNWVDPLFELSYSDKNISRCFSNSRDAIRYLKEL